MPIVLLLIVIIVILLGGAGLIFGALWGLLVLLWAALPWMAGIAALMFGAALVKGALGSSSASNKPARRSIDQRETRARPHIVADAERAAMADQQRLNAEYRAKIAAAKKARGE